MRKLRRRRGFGFNAVRHEQRHPWLSFATRALLCLGTGLFVQRLVPGGLGVALTLPLCGYLLAGDLLELLLWLRRLLRPLFWRDVQGRFFAFKGLPIRVDLDTPDGPWLHLGDLARALDEPLRAALLRRHFPTGLRELPQGDFLSASACLDYLRQRSSDRALRLRRWVEREVVFPARRQR